MATLQPTVQITEKSSAAEGEHRHDNTAIQPGVGREGADVTESHFGLLPHPSTLTTRRTLHRESSHDEDEVVIGLPRHGTTLQTERPLIATFVGEQGLDTILCTTPSRSASDNGSSRSTDHTHRLLADRRGLLDKRGVLDSGIASGGLIWDGVGPAMQGMDGGPGSNSGDSAGDYETQHGGLSSISRRGCPHGNSEAVDSCTDITGTRLMPTRYREPEVVFRTEGALRDAPGSAGEPLNGRIERGEPLQLPIMTQGGMNLPRVIYAGTTPKLDEMTGISPQPDRSEQLLSSTRLPDPLPFRQPRSSTKKAPTYDGDSSWKDYLVQFEMVSELNEWPESTKAMELATSLRLQAQGVLSDIDPAERKNFNHLVKALTDRFEPDNLCELFRAQLKHRLRTKEEPLVEVASDIKKLVRKTYPTSSLQMRDTLARDCFVDSLSSPEMEWAIYQGKPQTIEDAVRLGLEYEAFQTGRRRSSGEQRLVRRQQEEPEKPSQLQDALNKILILLTKMENKEFPSNHHRFNTHQTDPEKRTCYNCDKIGHIVRDCPQPRKPRYQNDKYNQTQG